VTLKSRLGIVQGRSKWRRSIDHNRDLALVCGHSQYS